jgi:undecaprenyl-diphosphatase
VTFWLPLAAVAALAGLLAAMRTARGRELTRRQAGSLIAGVGGGGLFLLALGAVVDGGGRAPGDAAVGAWTHGFATPTVVAAMGVVAIVGSLTIVGPVLLGVAYVLWRRQRPGPAALVVAVVLAQAAISGLKLWIARPRPDDPLAAAAGLSFPSGHATLAALVGFFAVWLVAEDPRRRVVLAATAGAAGWMLLVCGSRVLLGVHYLSDVVAGTGLGLAVGGLSMSLPALARSRRRSP